MRNAARGIRLSSNRALLVTVFALLLAGVAMIAGPVSSAQNQKSTPGQEDNAAAVERARAQTEQPFDVKKEILGDRDLSLRPKRPQQKAKGSGGILPTVAPSNDLCAGAIAIPGAGPFPVLSATTADITDATTTGDPTTPSCQTNISRSIWYTFTPATTAFYEISTCADTPTGTTVDDTVLTVYTSAGGCAGPFTEVATTTTTDGCDDDSCITEGLQSVLSTQLTGGTTYYFLVWKFDTPPPTAGNTAVQISVDLIPVASNDTCATAVPLTLNIPTAGSINASTTNDYQLPAVSACFPAGHTASTSTGRDVVYSFIAPAAGQYSFRAWQYVSPGTSNVVTYLSSTCPAATPGTPVTVTCLSAANIQASTGGEEMNCVSLSAGEQVFFFVDEATVGAGGDFYALVESCGTMETEPNNTPAQAGPLSCGIQGQVNPATEADFYSIGTPATGSRIFAMVDSSTAGTSADVDLRVNTATDTLEFDDLSNDVQYGVSGFSPNIAGFNATGGPLFFQVDRFGSAPTGIANPYRLYSVVQPPSVSAAPEAEPNDTTATASIAVNNYFSGALQGASPSTDVDLYAFDAVAGDLIMLNLDGDPERNNTPVDTRLQLLDSSGAILVNVNGSGGTNTLDNANPPGLFESQPVFVSEALLFHAPTTGRYYAQVSAGSASVTTAAGNYLLSITKNCTIGGGIAPTFNGIISEFRLYGPAGPTDEFIEIYNNSSSSQNVAASDGSAGWAVAASDGVVRCTIPNGTIIPARGHFLCANSAGYSLSSYPAGDGTTATADATYTTDIPPNVGIALFNNATPANFTLANRLDAVGSTTEANILYKEGTGYPALSTGGSLDVIQYSFYRRIDLATGLPADSDNNATDLFFVDTNGTSAGAGQRLGAPGPENLSGPVQRNATLKISLVDAGCGGSGAATSACARSRDFTSDPANNSTFGTFDIRRKVTNNTGGAVTRLRYRVVDITTFPSPPGTADLRPRTGTTFTANLSGGGTTSIEGTTLEQPPSQPNGGGFNSSLSSGTVTLGSPLAAGASINVHFLLGVQQAGAYRFFINIEALP